MLINFYKRTAKLSRNWQRSATQNNKVDSQISGSIKQCSAKQNFRSWLPTAKLHRFITICHSAALTYLNQCLVNFNFKYLSVIRATNIYAVVMSNNHSAEQRQTITR